MIASNMGKAKLEKIKEQRGRIKKLIMQGEGAFVEMPNHEVLFSENIEWLEKYGIKVERTKDRDGRPIMFLDINEIELSISQDYETLLKKEPLLDGNLRTQTSGEGRQ